MADQAGSEERPEEDKLEPGERELLGKIFEHDEYLSSGYDTISSGSDEDQVLKEVA